MSAPAGASVRDVISRSGRPLPRGVRDVMERGFGTDFSDVRIHDSLAAAVAARSIGALAFASGEHIGFAPGAFDPSTRMGRELLAHELAHVIQQRAGSVPAGRIDGDIALTDDDRFERAAQTAATAALTQVAAPDSHRGAESAGLQAAAPAAVGSIPTVQPMTFKRFSRFGALSNWGAYNEREKELLELVEKLTGAFGSLEPSLAKDRGVGTARETFERLRDADLSEGEYQNAKQELTEALGRIGRARDRAWTAKRAELREVLVGAERDPKRFDAVATRASIDKILRASVGELRGERLQAGIDDLRELVDTMPSYVPEYVVNLGHTALNPYDRQIGLPGVGYLGPSRTEDNKHVMNRGISEVVTIEGTPYVPVYIAVFGDALGSSTPKYKDVGQDSEGRVQIHSGGGQGGDLTLWVSLGRPLRQVKWLEKYSAQGAPEPLIRSFLIPLEVADDVSKASITEHESAGSNKDMNVDKHYERNQFGVVNAKSIEQLRAYALPGSLRTYTDAAIAGRPASWGEVRSTAELRERLGVPARRIPGYPIFVDPTKQEFTGKSEYKKQIDGLTRIYAYHTGNPVFLPSSDTGQPEAMPSADVRQRKVNSFYLNHRPPGMDRVSRRDLERFIEEYVAPWATQAQIAEAISEDYDDISGPERESLPTTAPEIQYTPPRERRLRGQRRATAIRLSGEQRELFGQRARLRERLGNAKAAIPGAYKELGKQAPATVRDAQRALGSLGKLIETINKDYKFVIGDAATIRGRLPEFTRLAREQLELLRPHSGLSNSLEVVVRELGLAVA